MIEGVAIVGANRKSAMLCEILLMKGFQIRVYDSFKDFLGILMSRIRWNLSKNNRLDLIENIEPIQDFSKFRGADIVIEIENKTFEERYLYFSKIMKEVDEKCIFALNSDIDLIKTFEKIPFLPLERVIGINFLDVFKDTIFEISKTDYTQIETIQKVSDFVDKLSLKHCIISYKPGGIMRRLMSVYINSAFTVLVKGKGFPSEIDDAIKKFTRSIYGPFEMLDIIGIDYDYNKTLLLYDAFKKEILKPNEIELKLLQYGQLGKKSNMGVYIYEDGKIVGENPVLPSIIKYLGLRHVEDKEMFSDIMIPILEESKEIAKEIMVGEQDIENITKYFFGWDVGIFSLQKKYPDAFIIKQKTEFDNLDTF
jgi:3-hydroxyacyl-CoA dehydrogenase